MSQTPLSALRRPLDALLRLAPFERLDTEPSPARPVRADGGERDDAEHLRDVPDGAGCTEIWEHLSERQASEASADD